MSRSLISQTDQSAAVASGASEAIASVSLIVILKKATSNINIPPTINKGKSRFSHKLKMISFPVYF